VPLLLRSLPLSFVTLWHYVFVLPIVLLFAVPLLVLTLLPLIGTVISLTIFTFFAIMGYRCALAAYGRGNEPAIDRLVKSAMFFGVFNTAVAILLLAACVLAAVGLASVGVEWNAEVPWGDAIPMVPTLAVIAFFVLNGLYNCAIAVPMAEAAAQATPKGRSADALFGIGRGMFSLAFLWILWLVGLFYSGIIQFVTEQVTYQLTVFFGSIFHFRPITVPKYDPLWVIGSTLVLMWGTCWYYATAVLAWADTEEQREARRLEVRAVSRMSADDLRALREARMQKNEGPTP
jgi:hypothetical protein